MQVPVMTDSGDRASEFLKSHSDKISFMSDSSYIPNIRNQERNDLIQKLAAHLQKDERVSAAWLAGSIARGDDDWLSDIDLYLAVDDEAIEEVVRGRHEFAAQPVTPTLSMDQMRNAPPKGGYLLVHYPGEFGPQHVDWFWQPESLARVPDNGRQLFDKVGLPVIDGEVWEKDMNQTESRPAIDSTDQVDLLTHDIKFFWAMSLIVAKYIVRGDGETVGHMMSLIERTLDRITEALEGEDWSRNGSSETDTAVRFRSLRVVSEQAKTLHGDLGDRGVVVPAEGITQVERFFDACETALLS